MVERATGDTTDRLLLLEVFLIITFIVLLFALYLIPIVTSATYQPGAWRWVTLAIPFFGALYLETRRRRRNQRLAVRAALDEEPDASPEPDRDDDVSEPMADEPPMR